MADDDYQLDEFFQQYRAACSEPDVGVNFMPTLWDKIERRRSFAFTFQQLVRPVMTVLLALCLLLFVLNITGTGQSNLSTASYADALAADNTVEKTDYTEAIRSSPTSLQAPAALRQLGR